MIFHAIYQVYSECSSHSICVALFYRTYKASEDKIETAVPIIARNIPYYQMAVYLHIPKGVLVSARCRSTTDAGS